MSASLTGEETLVQLVAPDGADATSSPSSDPYRERAAHIVGPDADPEILRGMYRDMVLVRRFDQEGTSLQRQGELGLFPQLLGQEAAQIGSGRALRPADFVFPSYREHGVAWTRGMDLTDLLKIFRGIDHGGWDPAEHNFHVYTLVIGSHTLHATGYAMGVQRDGLVGTGDPDKDMAVVAYFGDGATSQGDVSEALGFAAVNNAPLVLFCQNNQWAISLPVEKQSRAPLYQRGWGFGVPSVQVDGNDVVACWAVMDEALERARSGGGPTFVEAVTYRMGAHTTSDDPTRYRTSAEEASWAERDPIARVHARLVAAGWWTDEDDAALDAEADALGVHVREVTRAFAAPAPESMFDEVYGSPNGQVEAERTWFAQYEAALAAGEGEA
ncbi:pyruvate dehydrogenase (acetyl-transferring) E1 component subunit alpha [Luteimicrobium subarcticum]|uniref:Pyruvate dehydrogenase E1 component alpha subunit n=1 Tax=Luteimicrobium subarcticum TaxID=620910 RepID=A0A2M8WRX2_9MICO|nr:pyruvate dehydrogenase (acetyl-transferring) E1 component subunit alpha [Luteimicrobium subarcticum]PJI93695.1 pyruvate dehydrogenase E1 component alpha subunit [Luteimicrobium subarcticum]